MGLVPTPEHDWAAESIAAIASVAERYIDLAGILELAHGARNPWGDEDANLPQDQSLSLNSLPTTQSLNPVHASRPLALQKAANQRPRVGIIRDSAFQFYYPENLEALVAAGADLFYTSPLREDTPPALDALYIGGGFPETHAEELVRNAAYRNAIKALAEAGMPIYAECGGLMYLGKELVLEGVAHAMCGVLPIVFGFSKRPQGHGYTRVSVQRENPYYAMGSILKGHEFHYSSVLSYSGDEGDLAFRMERGSGIVNGLDGICFGNVLATYTHLHALGTPAWAEALVKAARVFRKT
jgi:cobyrinic acid a,c-diamide synthase